jgi:hypothetical protein
METANRAIFAARSTNHLGALPRALPFSVETAGKRRKRGKDRGPDSGSAEYLLISKTALSLPRWSLKSRTGAARARDGGEKKERFEDRSWLRCLTRRIPQSSGTLTLGSPISSDSAPTYMYAVYLVYGITKREVTRFRDIDKLMMAE